MTPDTVTLPRILVQALSDACLLSLEATTPGMLGTQAGDALETAYLPAGLKNLLTAEDCDRAVAAGLRFFRTPANCSSKASPEGVVPESYLERMKQQVDVQQAALRKAGLPPLVWLDFNHHNNPRKHVAGYQTNWPAEVWKFTEAQHAVRDTAIAVQVARYFEGYDEHLSFDIFNEPAGITPDELNAWHHVVVPAIRALGGYNAKRKIWLEPIGNTCYALTVPPGGNIGFSPHIYTPFAFTHGNGALTPAGLAAYLAEVRLAKAHAKRMGVDLAIGEAGVKLGKTGRDVFIQHLRNVARDEGVSTCLWDYATNFALYDRTAKNWMPGIEEALTGNVTVPAFPQPAEIDTTQGVMDANNYGGTYKDGVVTLPALAAGQAARYLVVVFPKARLTCAGRVFPEVPGQAIMQIMPYKSDGKGGNLPALQKGNKQRIHLGYRSADGATSELPEMEEGTYVAAVIEQLPGTPVQTIKLRGWAA